MERQFAFCPQLAFCYAVTCYTPQEMCLTCKWIYESGVQGGDWASDTKGSFISMWMTFNVMRLGELMQVISSDKEQQASTRAEPRHKYIYL